jgi:uncharacterized protein with GYD domain
MPIYMFQGHYTQAAVKNLVAKPENRSKAASSIAKAAGGKLLEYFMSFGEYDFVAIVELPNDEAAAAVSLAVGAAGHITGISTTKLLTPAEAMKAMEIAASAAGSVAVPKGK